MTELFETSPAPLDQKINEVLHGTTYYVRIMTKINYRALAFLTYQIGYFVEEPPKEPCDSPRRLFYLRGFGATRAAALAMAGVQHAKPIAA